MSRRRTRRSRYWGTRVDEELTLSSSSGDCTSIKSLLRQLMKKRLTVVKRRRKVLITPWTVRSTYVYNTYYTIDIVYNVYNTNMFYLEIYLQH